MDWTSLLHWMGVIGLGVAPLAVIYATVSRKLYADFQARVGPAMAGRAGSLQFFADSLKVLNKARFSDRNRLSFGRHILYVQAAVLAGAFASMPLGSWSIAGDGECAVLSPLVAWVLVLAMQMVALLREPEPRRLLAGTRGLAVSLSALLPLTIVVLGNAAYVGGLSWQSWMSASGPYPYSWLVFRSPWHAISVIVALLCSPAVVNRRPFDVSSELLESTTDGGMSWCREEGVLGSSLRLFAAIILAVFVVVLFFGGAQTPEWFADLVAQHVSESALGFLQLWWLCIKALIVLLVQGVFSLMTPRLRADQSTKLIFGVLTPAALIVSILVVFTGGLW